MKDPYTAYVRQVRRELDVPRRQKKELLRGFQSEIEERFPGTPSLETLVTDMGRPEEVACTLLEAVDPKEHTRFNSARFRWFRIAVAALVLIVILTVGTIIYLDSTEFKRVEVGIIRDQTPTSYSTNENEG